MHQQSLSATPGIIPGLNYQLYSPCVQCKHLPEFLTVTVGLDCHPPFICRCQPAWNKIASYTECLSDPETNCGLSHNSGVWETAETACLLVFLWFFLSNPCSEDLMSHWSRCFPFPSLKH